MDEAGDHGYKRDNRSLLKPLVQPFLVFALVVIEDKKTKQRIARIVKQTIGSLRGFYDREDQIPKDLRRGILRGQVLAEHPDIKARFFRRLASPGLRWHAFVALFDKRQLQPQLPEDKGRRYAQLFRNVYLASYSVPRNQRFITLTVDQRDERKEARKQFNQMILATFRSKKKKASRAVLWIYHRQSIYHRGLQLADIFAYFGLQKLKLAEEKKTEQERQLELELDILATRLSWRKPRYFGRGIKAKTAILLERAAELTLRQVIDKPTGCTDLKVRE